MNDSRSEEQDAGLCARCAHALVIRNDRGSRFYLCRLSATDPRFAKYPPLPVRRCTGFVPSPEDDDQERA
jgi:hypothetical protein